MLGQVLQLLLLLPYFLLHDLQAFNGLAFLAQQLPPLVSLPLVLLGVKG